MTAETNQGFHFFASSQFEWNADADLKSLLKRMDKVGYPYNIFYIPLPLQTAYKINNYNPVVDGAVFLGQYQKEQKK